MTMGRLFNGTRYLNGKVAECIVYTSEITGANRQKIESYLAIKYGITNNNSAGGTAGDYIVSDGTTVWDASATTHVSAYSSNRIEIDMSTLPEGMYILKADNFAYRVYKK